MKKLIALLLIIFAIPIYAQFTTVWQKSAATSSLPSWFTTSSLERGFAYGLLGGNHRLYVASRNGGTYIRVMNAVDGTDVSTLSTTGISGGIYTVNDVEVSNDGIIYVCNLVTNASSANPFKIYRYADEASAPTVAVSIGAVAGANLRIGDRITAVGSASDNSLRIYAATPTVAGRVYVFTTTDNGNSFSVDSIAVAGTTIGSIPSITPTGNGNVPFYWKANGTGLQKNNYNGTQIGVDVISSVSANGNPAIKYLGLIGSDEYLAAYEYGSGKELARIIKIPNGTPDGSTESSYGITTALGTNANANGVGDVAFKNNGDGTYTIYVLGSNNGIGAYKTNLAPLPVELTSFTAIAKGCGVELSWKTATEVNNHGFEIEKYIGGNWSNVGFVEGAGTTNAPQSYSFVDASKNGTASYRLKQIDRDGKFEYSKEVEVTIVSTPTVFALSQNYPNPFNPTTVINYSIASASNVMLKVFDLLGKEVAVLVNGPMAPGSYTAEFNAQHLPSGVYFYRLDSGRFTDVKRLTIMK